MKELIFPQKGLDKKFFRFYVFLIYLIFVPTVTIGFLVALYYLFIEGVPSGDIVDFIGGTFLTFIIFILARSVLYRGFLFVVYGNKKEGEK